jgi:hypothetical protein
MPIIQGFAGALDLFQNIGGFCGPDEGLRLLIVLVNIGADGCD